MRRIEDTNVRSAVTYTHLQEAASALIVQICTSKQKVAAAIPAEKWEEGNVPRRWYLRSQGRASAGAVVQGVEDCVSRFTCEVSIILSLPHRATESFPSNSHAFPYLSRRSTQPGWRPLISRWREMLSSRRQRGNHRRVRMSLSRVALRRYTPSLRCQRRARVLGLGMSMC